MTTGSDGNPQVRRAKRSWPAQRKLDILDEIDRAKLTGESGAVGEILRREGLYSSLISEWRNQRDRGALAGLTDQKPGRKPKDPARVELTRLQDRLRHLEAELEEANRLIHAQGKAWALSLAMSRRSAEPSTGRP